MDTQDLCAKIYGSKFNFSSEIELQAGIEQLLISLSVSYQKEVILNPEDRIDFMVEKVGIEVKTDGTTADVTRQLWRYAKQPTISELILVTTRSKHRVIESPINGKPLYIVHLITFL